MAGVGKDLWELLVQPPAKSGPPEQVAQGHIQVGFQYPRRDSTASLAACAVPCQPLSKEDCPHIQMELPVFQSVPIALFPVTGHSRQECDLWRSSVLTRQLTTLFNATAGIKELLGNISFFFHEGRTLKVTEFCVVCYTKLFLTWTFSPAGIMCDTVIL